jgi:hypothetical protein
MSAGCKAGTPAAKQNKKEIARLEGIIEQNRNKQQSVGTMP